MLLKDEKLWKSGFKGLDVWKGKLRGESKGMYEEELKSVRKGGKVNLKEMRRKQKERERERDRKVGVGLKGTAKDPALAKMNREQRRLEARMNRLEKKKEEKVGQGKESSK